MSGTPSRALPHWRMCARARAGAKGRDPEGSEAREGVAGVSLRVALFTDSYRPTVDGVVNSVLATRQSLEAHGHRVFTFAPEDPDNGHSVERDTIFLKAKGFRPYPGYRLAIFPGRELEALSDLDVDIIHSHGIGFMGIKSLWC